MFYRRNWIAMTVVILGLAMFIPVAQAERQEFESIHAMQSPIMLCNSAQKWLLRAMMRRVSGRAHMRTRFSIIGPTIRSVLIKMVGGKWSWHGFSKRMGPDGEFIIWEINGDSESGTTGKPVYGTGKWKGVKGEAKGKAITAGKPIVQGTNQSCQKYIGWIELPK